MSRLLCGGRSRRRRGGDEVWARQLSCSPASMCRVGVERGRAARSAIGSGGGWGCVCVCVCVCVSIFMGRCIVADRNRERDIAVEWSLALTSLAVSSSSRMSRSVGGKREECGGGGGATRRHRAVPVRKMTSQGFRWQFPPPPPRARTHIHTYTCARQNARDGCRFSECEF